MADKMSSLVSAHFSHNTFAFVLRAIRVVLLAATISSTAAFKFRLLSIDIWSLYWII